VECDLFDGPEAERPPLSMHDFKPTLMAASFAAQMGQNIYTTPFSDDSGGGFETPRLRMVIEQQSAVMQHMHTENERLRRDVKSGCIAYEQLRREFSDFLRRYISEEEDAESQADPSSSQSAPSPFPSFQTE